MNKKQGILLCVGAFFLALLFTGICFYAFPQYICCTVYWANASEIEAEDWKDIGSGMTLEEDFVPQQKYLASINIHVGECEKDTLLIGKLCDAKGKVLTEHTLEAKKGYVTFEMQRWVSTEEKYTFLLTGHGDNKEAVPVSFGGAIKGPAEHVLSRVDNVADEGSLWTQYVYNTYSKKLLAFWFLAFFAVAFWILETCLPLIKKHCR